jgi:hypothetical protein
VGADRSSADDLAGLADDIGRPLSKLHRVDPGRVPPPSVAREQHRWGELRADLLAVGDIVRPLLARAGPYLTGGVPELARTVRGASSTTTSAPTT